MYGGKKHEKEQGKNKRKKDEIHRQGGIDIRQLGARPNRRRMWARKRIRSTEVNPILLSWMSRKEEENETEESCSAGSRGVPTLQAEKSTGDCAPVPGKGKTRERGRGNTRGSRHRLQKEPRRSALGGHERHTRVRVWDRVFESKKGFSVRLT